MAERKGLSPADATKRAEFRSTVAGVVLALPASERKAIVLRVAKLRRQLDQDLGSADWRRAAIAVAPSPVSEEPEQALIITMTDTESGEPIAGQPWFVVRTGEHDYGRVFGLGPQEPNPKPMAEGITGAGGEVRLELPVDMLLNLCTGRNERYARGSWPIRIENDAVGPSSVKLSIGTTFHGHVIDDVGEPVPGMSLAAWSYSDEWVVLGVTDEAGQCELPRRADLSRSFVIREDCIIEPRWMDKGPPEIYRGVHLDLLANGAATVEVKDAVVPRRGQVTGTVRDEKGDPISGALISQWWRRDGSCRSRRSWRSLRAVERRCNRCRAPRRAQRQLHLPIDDNYIYPSDPGCLRPSA